MSLMMDSPRTRGLSEAAGLRRDNRGVASTVATMLSLLVMLLFLDLALIEIIPRQQNDAEFVTTQTAISTFEQLHGLAQGAVISAGDTLGAPGLTVTFPLGTQGVSPLQPATTGTLTFDPTAGGAEMWFNFVPHFRRGEVAHVDQDIILAIDSSGSMSWNDPTRLRITGAQEYIDRLSCPDHVASIDFDSVAHLTRENIGGAPHHLTDISNNCFPNFSVPRADVDTIDSAGSTNSGGALYVGVNEHLGYGDPKRARVIILLTDGQNTICSPTPPCFDPDGPGPLTSGSGSASDALAKQQSRRARDHGIVIYTIGLGAEMGFPNANCPGGQVRGCLKDWAEVTGGSYFEAPTAASIRWIYYEISRHFTGSFICGNLVSGDVGAGTLSLELRNREFPAQTLTYESGGIVRRQSDGAFIMDGPGVQWTTTATKGPAGALSIDLVALTGKEFRAEGSDPAMVSIRPLGRDLQTLEITKVNLTDVNNFLTKENQNLDYWTTQGASTPAATASVETPINQAKALLTTAQGKVDQGNLSSAKGDIDSITAKFSDVIAAAQTAATAGTMQKWLADDTTDDMLLQQCYMTQWENWYDGLSVEITSNDTAAWMDWMARTAKSSGMQYTVSRLGNTAVLTIRAVDRVFIERRILSVTLSG